jgi:hypothetical protein
VQKARNVRFLISSDSAQEVADEDSNDPAKTNSSYFFSYCMQRPGRYETDSIAALAHLTDPSPVDIRQRTSPEISARQKVASNVRRLAGTGISSWRLYR